MKSVFTAMLSVLVAAPVFALDIGESMPKVRNSLTNIDGTKISLDEMKSDKGILVFFTCNHCPYSKAWEARYTKLGNEMMKKGVKVVAINSNDPTKQKEDDIGPMKDKAKRLGMKFPYTVDETSDFARSFGATRTPEFFFFNGEGKLAYKGAFDDNAENAKGVKANYLRDAMTATMNKKAVKVAETKSIGCGIKFRERRRTADIY